MCNSDQTVFWPPTHSLARETTSRWDVGQSGYGLSTQLPYLYTIKFHFLSFKAFGEVRQAIWQKVVLIIYLLLEKGQTAKLIRPPKQQVQLQYTLQIISDHIRKSS